MSVTDRDTHFADFARLLWQELLIHSTFEHKAGRSAEYGAEMEQIIASRAYDLVYHALYCNGVDARYWPGKPEQASEYYKRQITKATNDVPDLTQWPEKP